MSIKTLSPARLARALLRALARRRGTCAAGAEAFAWPALEGRRLPASYERAEWRGTLPVDAEGRLGLSFNLEAGEVLRLGVGRESARHVAETIALYLRGHGLRPSPPPRPGQAPPSGPSPALSK